MAYVLDYLQGRGVTFTVIPHRDGTGDARPSDLVAKTVVVIANYGPALVVIPTTRKLDMALVAEAVGDP